jgi:hypothetical protein
MARNNWKSLINQPVSVATARGMVEGTLLSVSSLSVWVLSGDIDVLVPTGEVSALTLAVQKVGK